MRWPWLLVAFFWSSVALGNAADCYWLITSYAGSDPFTIRVVYESGHSITVSVGDYLPLGCNVDHFEIVSCPATGGGMELHNPACRPDAVFRIFAQEWMEGQVYPIGGWIVPALGLSCNGCEACSDPPPSPPGSPNPNNPLPGAHPDPDGDDDGDGVRNECDPDEVQCWDVDLDGICDHCGNDYQPEEDNDGDGVPNDCDPDYSECDDFNDDGCCDYCSPAQCGGEEEPCPPTDPRYPDCDEFDSCKDCNPCPKLDTIIAILTHWDAYGVPVNLGSPSGSTPTPTLVEPEVGVESYEFSLPDVNWSGTLNALSLPIPMPGGTRQYKFGVRPVEDFAQSQLPASALLSTLFMVDLVRSTLRLLLLILVTWNFVKHVFRLFVSL